MTMTITDPYAHTFDAYWKAGWRGVLPLPYKAKKHPPAGYTGRGYTEPSYADCTTWADGGPQNIALHLPRGVIGIDVDDYADKGGGATLQALVEECGPLPATWMSTSRGDGISGIRLFRVPADIELIGGLTGIEFIQYSHRYVVCWPSVHPETGAVYEWVDETTGEAGVPPLAALPALPDAWIVRLVKTSAAAEKADVGTAEIAAFFAGLPDGPPCQHMVAAAGLAMRDKSRHDAYNDAVLAVLSRGRAGCPGAATTLKRLKKSFIAEITTGDEARATVGEAGAEWQRSVVGAVGLVVAEHPEQGAGCPDDYVAGLILAEAAGQAPDEPETAEDDENELKYRLAVARKAAEMQLLDDARDVLAARKAGKAPELASDPLAVFLAQPDEVVPYRIDGLWPVNGRVLLAAAAKAGKTTLVMNLLKALADGGTFLGCFDVTALPAGRTIVYLNMEVSPAQIRRWLRRAGIVNTDIIHVVNLRGAASALTLNTEQGRHRVAAWLRTLDAGMVILDPLAPLLASLGVDENNNSEVAKFFSLWAETLALADVADDLIVHHTGHAGQRSRGAARFLDEPDALWTISKDTAVDEDGDEIYEAQEPRFFKATGRDVEQAEQPLDYDGASGVLTLGVGNRKQMRAEAALRQAETRVLLRIDDGKTTTRDIIKENGNEKQNYSALERLVERGVLVKQDLGRGRPTLYRRKDPTVATVATVANDPLETVATGGVASLYRGDTPTTPPEEHQCEDCSGDTGSAGFKICATCEQLRRNP